MGKRKKGRQTVSDFVRFDDIKYLYDIMIAKIISLVYLLSYVPLTQALRGSGFASDFFFNQK